MGESGSKSVRCELKMVILYWPSIQYFVNYAHLSRGVAALRLASKSRPRGYVSRTLKLAISF